MAVSHGPSLTHPLFTEQEFTPTKFSNSGDKASFANALCNFIASDFKQSFWTQKFYQRLSMTWGHIAHHDKMGFWQEFFAELSGKVAFLRQTLAYPCYGQPEYTHCDVEHAVQARLTACKRLETYIELRAAEIEATERATLDGLRAKYEGVPPLCAVDLPILRPPVFKPRQPAQAPGQHSLL